MAYELVDTKKGMARVLLDESNNVVSHSIKRGDKSIDFKIGQTIGDTRKLNGLTYDQTVEILDELKYKIERDGDKFFLSKAEHGDSVRRY